MKQKKLLPDLDGPMYGIPFDVIGFQALDEKGNYTDLIETTGYTGLRVDNRREYLKLKESIGKLICDGFNKSLRIKWDKIVSLKVKYLCTPGDHYI